MNKPVLLTTTTGEKIVPIISPAAYTTHVMGINVSTLPQDQQKAVETLVQEYNEYVSSRPVYSFEDWAEMTSREKIAEFESDWLKWTKLRMSDVKIAE